MEHVTLFQAQPIPNWGEKIHQFLCNPSKFDALPKHRHKQLQEESRRYAIIGKQLYRRGMDGQLRLCVCENEYIHVLHCVHSGVGAGHFSGKSTAKQIIYSGLWWPTLYGNA